MPTFSKQYAVFGRCTGYRLLTIGRKSQKNEEFSTIYYLDLCFYQILFRNDFSQKVIFAWNGLPDKSCEQLEIECYPKGLGKASRADRTFLSSILTQKI